MKKFAFLLLFFAVFYKTQTKQDKIKEFIALSGAFQMTEEVKTQYLSQFKKKYPEVPELEWNEISKKIDANELVSQNIEIYSKYFSDEEINQLLKFYKTDLGKKLIKISPTIIAEVQNNSTNWVQKNSELINNTLVEKGYLTPPPPPDNNYSPPPPMK